MTGEQIIYAYARFLASQPTPGEIIHAAQNCTTDTKHNCYLQLDPRIFSEPIGKRKNLLVYSSCHAEQICVYLNAYRQDVMDQCYLHMFFSHRATLGAPESNNRLVHSIFGAADYIIWNDLAENFGCFSTAVLGKHCKTGVQIVSFVPPSCACFWPICEHHGEIGVVDYLDAGCNVNEIIERFLAGKFNYQYESRFQSQIDRLRYREAHRDVKISSYVLRHLKTHRMFFTYNHPSFHLIAYIVENCLGYLGFKELPEEHSLEVPQNLAAFGNHYPDHSSSFNFFSFAYPMDFARERGGANIYYPTVINEAAARWEGRNRMSVEDNMQNDY